MYIPVWLAYLTAFGAIIALLVHANTIYSVYDQIGPKKKITIEFVIGLVIKFMLALASLALPIYLMYERL